MMGATSRPGLDIGALLEAVENAPPVAAADVVGAMLAERLDASQVAFLIADFGGDAVIRLTHTARPSILACGREIAELVTLRGSAHGQVLADQTVSVRAEGGGWRVLAPVTNRGEAIGILELLLDDGPDDQSLADVALVAHTLAYIVIANRRYTDLFEWGQRSTPLSLAAEVQHRLLPAAYTCEAAQFTLAGWLEPAGEIAGDTFDFSLDRDTLHLSMTDAMGHALESAILATVLVGSLRNGRRAGLDLTEQAERASADLATHFHRCEYVTGLLARIDLPSGTAAVINAGHPPPLRVRDGNVSYVDLKPDLPFGLGQHRYRVQRLPLAPGDRLVFLTDGLVERNGPDIDIQALVGQSAAMHPREAVQHMVQAVLDATGSQLKDDATVMCVDWHRAPGRLRASDSGADV